MFEQVTQQRSRWRIFWPDVDEIDGAQEAIKLGYGASFVVAALTTAMAAFGLMGAGFADAVVFALLGAGLLRKWRTAAVLGLALFCVNIVLSISRGRGVGALAIILFFCFASSVRGTFAYWRLVRAIPAPPAGSTEEMRDGAAG